MRPTGLVMYEGKSRIDGKPIAMVATLSTTNAKTGDMIQTWILRRFVNPIQAINNGGDYSICGSCAYRGTIRNGTNRGRGCYVNIANAPRAVWGAYRRGVYPRYCASEHKELFRGRKLRLGSYGDPVAVPLSTWRPILRLMDGYSGYTHSWREKRFRYWSRYVMASTHSIGENRQALARGFRTFRTRLPDSDLAENEVICPASTEGGHTRDCASCLACNGGSTSKRSISIVVHGPPSVVSSALSLTA